MDTAQLSQVAQKIFTPGKGILASDGRSVSLKKRFEKLGIAYDQEKDRKFRQIFYTTSGFEEYISGVILNEETVKWSSDDGKPFPKLLEEKGVLPGVKVDKGTVDLPNFPGEKVTEGMDGLRDRLSGLPSLGVKFTKWRAVFLAEEGKPSHVCIKSNCDLLARYAAFSQEVNLVPVVEPEVLMDGVHTASQTKDVTVKVLKQLFNSLFEYKVNLEGLILKINMAVSGLEAKETPLDTVANLTLAMLKDGVSVGIPGIVFLSGGQDAATATKNLNAICKTHDGKPWKLSFSFERALQNPSLEAWGGKDENVSLAQKLFLERARLNSLAVKGEYLGEAENGK